MLSAAKGGGTKTRQVSQAGRGDGLFHRVEHGDAEDGLAALAGHDARDDLRAVVEHFLGVELRHAAGDALHDDAAGTVKKDAHQTALIICSLRSFFQAITARSAASISVLARMIGRPDCARIFWPSSTLVPESRTITGTSTGSALQRLHDALGHPVAAVDAREDVDQDRLHVLVRHDQPEGLGHPFRRGPAADVEEVGGLAPGQLDRVHRRHRKASAVHDAADVAGQPDIGEAPVGGVGLRAGLPGFCRAARRSAGGGKARWCRRSSSRRVPGCGCRR